MDINQYINSWSDTVRPYFYGNSFYTWNSPSVDGGFGNYLPRLDINNVSVIPQGTQFTIDITNNATDWHHYHAGELKIDFGGGKQFNLMEIWTSGDPIMLDPEESWSYNCTLPQSVNPSQFALIPKYDFQDVPVTIRVFFPEIFTGWMTSLDGMYQYDSSSSGWSPY